MDLGNYVEVHERIGKFDERYPEGSLRGTYELVDLPCVDGERREHIVYRAEAFRHPDDKRPGIGFAQEVIPGTTPYTQGSELMNAETSAWGRALAALGIEVHRGVASGNEVRSAEGKRGDDSYMKRLGFASDKQRGFMENLLKKAGSSAEERGRILAWADGALTGGRDGPISAAIDALNEGEDGILERLTTASEKWAAEQSDVPADTDDLADPAEHDDAQTSL